MSTFTNALRRSQLKVEPSAPRPDRSEKPGDRAAPFSVIDRAELHRAEADMEVLYKSIASALADIPGGKMILFVSARPGEGKTTAIAALATMLTKNMGLSVLVLDAARKASFCNAFPAESLPSLAALTQQPADAIQAIRDKTGASLVAVPIDMTEVVSRTRSVDAIAPAETIALLKAHFNFIFVDVASLAETAWVVGLGRQMDGVVLVVEAERTRWPVARHALREFEKVQARVLGVFLNKRRFYIPPKVYRWL